MLHRSHDVALPDNFSGAFDQTRVPADGIARAKPVRQKALCKSIPAVVGPWRGKMRSWHAPTPARARDQREDMLSCGSVTTWPGPAVEPVEPIPRQARIARIRAALRRERHRNAGGKTTISLERQRRLALALARLIVPHLSGIGPLQ